MQKKTIPDLLRSEKSEKAKNTVSCPLNRHSRMTVRKLMSLLALMMVILAACTQGPKKQEASKGLSGAYLGQALPDKTPVLFAPGIISTALHDDGAPRFSEDGTEVYFRKWAVPHDIIGVMKQERGVWSEPELFKPFGKYVFITPVFIPGSSRALFISRRPFSGEGEPSDYNIWAAEKSEKGWINLEYLDHPVNTPGDDLAYSVSAAGTVFLQAQYADSLGAYDIYYSRLVDGIYQKAINIGAPINTKESESAPFIAPDESYLVFCAFNYEDSFGDIDLYVSFKKEDGSWSESFNLGGQINTKAGEKFPAISPDGRFLFYVSDQYADRSYIYSDATYHELLERNLGPSNGLGGDIYWVSTEVLQMLNPFRN